MMTTDLERSSLPDRLAYAQALSGAKLLPEQFRGKPSDVLLAMEWGAALGMAPMQAINSIHIINGKPGLSANALAALVRREGHRMRVTGDDKHAAASIWRKDDPEFEYTVTWTMDMAKRAGLLTGKDNWSKYPGAMLKARAQTAVVRDACPELIIGLPGDDDTDGPDWHTPITTTTTVTVDQVPVEDLPATDAEYAAIVHAAANLGIEGPEALRMLVLDVLGDGHDPLVRMTVLQAAQVLAHLGTIAAPEGD